MPDPKPAWPRTHDGAFATTQWTMLAEAARDGDAESERALAKLCETYWPPVYAFIRRSGKPPEDAKDLTQGFFASLLEKRHFAGADKSKGKFRTYLLGAVKFFLSDERAHANAQKRGGGSAHLSIDAEEAEHWMGNLLVDEATPDLLFDRQWIRTVIANVTQALSDDYEGRGNGDLFEEIKAFLIGGRQERTYSQIATEHGISESAVKMSVKRLRERFGERLREKIAETVDSDDEVDGEIRALMAIYQ